jgi:hypothetical protein
MPANTRARLIFSDKHVLKPIFGEAGKLRRLSAEGAKESSQFLRLIEARAHLNRSAIRNKH